MPTSKAAPIADCRAPFAPAIVPNPLSISVLDTDLPSGCNSLAYVVLESITDFLILLSIGSDTVLACDGSIPLAIAPVKVVFLPAILTSKGFIGLLAPFSGTRNPNLPISLFAKLGIKPPAAFIFFAPDGRPLERIMSRLNIASPPPA